MADRVLVTGGAGFIGRRLVRRLLDDGHEVVVLDSLLEGVHGPNASPPAEIRGAHFIRGDVRDKDAWIAGLGGVDVVYHLAAETGTGESMYRSHRYVTVNVGGTALLCDLMLSRTAGDVQRVVLASSRAVYGEGAYDCDACGVAYPEPRRPERLSAARWEPTCPRCDGSIRVRASSRDTRTRPTSTYGVTKRDQEELLHLLLPPAGVPVTSLRLQNVYGPGQSLRNPYTGILSIFSVRLLAGQGVRVFEDGAESRDFVFVDDVVEAFVRAAKIAPGTSTVVDVGSGRATSVLDVAHLLVRCLLPGSGARDLIDVTGEYRVGDIRHAVADLSAMEAELGFRPVTPLERGLEAFTAWVRRSEAPESTLDAALLEMARAGLLSRARPSG